MMISSACFAVACVCAFLVVMVSANSVIISPPSPLGSTSINVAGIAVIFGSFAAWWLSADRTRKEKQEFPDCDVLFREGRISVITRSEKRLKAVEFTGAGSQGKAHRHQAGRPREAPGTLQLYFSSSLLLCKTLPGNPHASSPQQVIADFDMTLTSFRLPDGSRGMSTHGILERSGYLGEEFTTRAKAIFNRWVC
eukprot:472732-Rhodomonas_salina.1